MRRRQTLAALAAATLAAAGAGLPGRARGEGSGRRIAITARRFAFSTQEIRATAGESITLEITSTDFVHGFSLPELGARVDVPPGAPVELPLRGLRAGRYTFLCDNFCGEEHDRMTGVLVVTPQDRR